jgi:hypothetical protein
MDAHRQVKPWPGWVMAAIGVLALLNGLPFLAPVFMKLGWDFPGRAIYFLYGLMCHQMAQRSFFLFGPGGFQMYNIADLPVSLGGLSPTAAMLALRQFWGNADMGWKVAWVGSHGLYVRCPAPGGYHLRVPAAAGARQAAVTHCIHGIAAADGARRRHSLAERLRRDRTGFPGQ